MKVRTKKLDAEQSKKTQSDPAQFKCKLILHYYYFSRSPHYDIYVLVWFRTAHKNDL